MTTADIPPLFPSASPVGSSDERPSDLIPLKEAAKSVDRAPPTLRDWIRAGDLRARLALVEEELHESRLSALRAEVAAAKAETEALRLALGATEESALLAAILAAPEAT